MKLQSTCSCGANVLLEDSGTGYTIRDSFTSWQVKHSNCSRSHPHENMNALCELKTEIARLTNKLAQKPWISLSEDDIKGITLAADGNIFSAIMFTHDKLKDKNYD